MKDKIIQKQVSRHIDGMENRRCHMWKGKKIYWKTLDKIRVALMLSQNRHIAYEVLCRRISHLKTQTVL